MWVEPRELLRRWRSRPNWGQVNSCLLCASLSLNLGIVELLLDVLLVQKTLSDNPHLAMQKKALWGLSTPPIYTTEL
jgi:hypothetical protein